MLRRKSSGAPLPFPFFAGIIPTLNLLRTIVLLGTGESGKSTIYRQLLMQSMKTPRAKDELIKFAEIIQSSLFMNFRMIIEAKEVSKQLNDQQKQLGKFLFELLDVYTTNNYQPELLAPILKEAKSLKALLSVPIVKDVIENTELYPAIQLSENAKYFFNDYERVTAADFEPNNEDLYRMHIKTTGIVKSTAGINLGAYTLTIIDTGGQKSERRKWVNAFTPAPNAVLFAVSLSECFQTCYEDLQKSRSEESKNCFKEWINSNTVANIPVYLIFTKLDSLEEKVKKQKVLFSSVFKDYGGDNTDVESIKQFIALQYKQLDTKNRIKGVYFLNSIDSKQVSSTLTTIVQSVN